MTNKEEGKLKKKVDGGKCNLRSRHYYSRRCKSKGLSSTTNIESLPDEMLFQVLLNLEAQEIYESAMLVSQRWYKIIRTRNFTQEHLEHSRPGLLFGDRSTCDYPTFLTVSGRGRGRFHMFKYPHRFKSVIWATCNGLALEDYFSITMTHKFFIANHTINKMIALPSFMDDHFYSCIGYAPHLKEYKVVQCYDPGLKNSKAKGCGILTLGVDSSWRYVDTKHISSGAARLLTMIPLTTEGFVHWTNYNATCLLSLNMETEIITETHIPQECQSHLEYYFYFSTWRSLTLLIASRSGLSWDVWEMNKELPGEWNKVLKIDLEAQKCRMEQQLECTLPKGLIPEGWLNYMEVLVLRICETTCRIIDKACVLYNVRTQEIQFLNLGGISRAYLHKNSLVWFDHT